MEAYLTGQSVVVELEDGPIELYVLSAGRVYGYELLGCVTTTALDIATRTAADNVPDFRLRAVSFAHQIADPDARSQFLGTLSPEDREQLQASEAEIYTFGFFEPSASMHHPRMFSIERQTDSPVRDDGVVMPPMPVIAHLPHTAIRMPLHERDALLLQGERQTEELRNAGDPLLPYLFEWVRHAGGLRFLNTASPLLVDPIRMPLDAEEPLSRVGRGAVPTRASNGDTLRVVDEATRETMLRQYYGPYTEALTQQVDIMLREFDACLILNIVSFPTDPCAWDLDPSAARPDVCIGIDELHSPQPLVDELAERFEAAGLRVEINRTISGAYVPPRHRGRDGRVSSVMIAFRKGLYTDEQTGEVLPDFVEFRARATDAISEAFQPWLASKSTYRAQSFNAQFTRLMRAASAPDGPTMGFPQELTDDVRTHYEALGLQVHPREMLCAAEGLTLAIVMGRDLERIGLLPPIDKGNARFNLLGTIERISDERSAFVQHVQAADEDREAPIGGPGWSWVLAEGPRETLMAHASALPMALIDRVTRTLLDYWSERLPEDQEYQEVLERLKRGVAV